MASQFVAPVVEAPIPCFLLRWFLVFTVTPLIKYVVFSRQTCFVFVFIGTAVLLV